MNIFGQTLLLFPSKISHDVITTVSPIKILSSIPKKHSALIFKCPFNARTDGIGRKWLIHLCKFIWRNPHFSFCLGCICPLLQWTRSFAGRITKENCPFSNGHGSGKLNLHCGPLVTITIWKMLQAAFNIILTNHEWSLRIFFTWSRDWIQDLLHQGLLHL